MNASLFNISPGISSGAMNLTMPFLAASAGNGFGEAGLYESLALELENPVTDLNGLPEIIQGAPVQSSSILTAQPLLEEIQPAGQDRAESTATSASPVLQTLALSALALLETGCSPDTVSNLSNEALIGGGVLVTALTVGSALLIRHVVRSRRAAEPLLLTNPIVEVQPKVEGIKLNGDTGQLEYLIYGESGVGVVENVGGKEQQDKYPPAIEFACTKDGRYVARNIARREGVQPRILRNGDVYTLPANGWAELQERDNILLVGKKTVQAKDTDEDQQVRYRDAANSSEPSVIEVPQYARQIRYAESGGAQLLKINVKELPNTPREALPSLTLKELPAIAVLSYRDAYVRASLSLFKGDSITATRTQIMLNENKERFGLIGTWQQAPQDLRAHYRATDPNASSLGARIPQAFVRDYVLHRTSEAMSLGYNFGNGGTPLVEEMIARLQAQRERRVYTESVGPARSYKAVESGASLSFGDEGSFERTFNFTDPGSKGELQEAQTDQPVHFSIQLDPDGYLRLNKHDESGRLVIHRANSVWKWQYFALSVDRDRGHLLQEGDVIAYKGRPYRVHTSKKQVTLLSISDAFLNASKAMNRPPVPAPARTRPDWMDALSSKRVRLQLVRDWMAQGNQMSTQLPALDRALQMIDEAVLHDRQLTKNQEELLQRAMKFVEQLEALIKRGATASEPEAPAQDADDEEVTVVRKLSDLKAAEQAGKRIRDAHQQTIEELRAGREALQDPQEQGYVDDMIEVIEEALEQDEVRELNATELMDLAAVRMLIDDARAGEANRLVEQLRKQWESVHWIARFEPEGTDQRKYLYNVLTILEDAVQAKSELADPGKTQVENAMRYVEKVAALESFKDLRATAGGLDRALENSQDSSPSLELDLPDGHRLVRESKSAVAKLTAQQEVFLKPYLREREAHGVAILEPLGHWTMVVDEDALDVDDEDNRVTVVPPAPPSVPDKDLRDQEQGRVYRIFQLIPNGVVGNLLNRADSALYRQAKTGVKPSYADRKAIKLALAYVNQVEALDSYQEMRRFIDRGWRDTKSQVARLMGRRRLAERAFLREADRIARETLPLSFYYDSAVTPIIPETIAAELRYRYPFLKKRAHRPLLKELVLGIYDEWEMRGSPQAERGYPGLPPERVIRSRVALTIGRLQHLPGMKRLIRKLDTDANSRRKLSAEDQEALIRQVLLVAGGHH